MTGFDDVINPYWVCIPMSVNLATSMHQQHWVTWEPELAGESPFLAQPEMGSDSISGAKNLATTMPSAPATPCVRHPARLRPRGLARLTAPQMALRRSAKPCVFPLACGRALQTPGKHPVLRLRRGRANILFPFRAFGSGQCLATLVSSIAKTIRLIFINQGCARKIFTKPSRLGITARLAEVLAAPFA